MNTHGPSIATMETVINSDRFIPYTLSPDVAKWMGDSTRNMGPHHCGQLPLANVWSLFPTC